MTKKPYEKEFKFTIKNNNGDIVAQEITSFGTEEYPFPEDWENNGMALKALNEYEEKFLKQHYSVEVSEDLTFDVDVNETTLVLIRALLEDRRTFEKANVKQDLTDLGNTIGQVIMKAYLDGKNEGNLDDFMSGLKHGISIIDGTHG